MHMLSSQPQGLREGLDLELGSSEVTRFNEIISEALVHSDWVLRSGNRYRGMSVHTPMGQAAGTSLATPLTGPLTPA